MMEYWFPSFYNSCNGRMDTCVNDRGVLILQNVTWNNSMMMPLCKNHKKDISHMCHTSALSFHEPPKQTIFDYFWEQFHSPKPFKREERGSCQGSQSGVVRQPSYGIHLGCFDVYM